MKNHRLVLPLAMFAPALLAQEHTVTLKPQSDKPMRYTIESSSKIESEQKMLINGEEGNFGGRGGGAGRGAPPQGPVSTQQKVVFVDGGSWREYQTAEAKVTRPGWDGESSEQSVTGELQGKKLSLTAEPAVMGDGDKTTPLAANVARGLPRKIDLSGLAPNKALALNGTYELGATFKDAIASLAHPIRAARGDGAPGQGGGRRNRGNQGADAGGGAGGGAGGDAAGGGAAGGGQRGQRGGRGAGGFGGGGADNVALQILSAPGVQPKITGKLVKVENGLATIELSGDVSGKGAPDKLGLGVGMGNMMGRRRGGAGGDQAAEPPAPAVNDGNVKVTVAGTMVVDTASNSLRSLDLKGSVETKTHTEMSREGRDGETMEIERTATQKGDFTVKVASEPAK